MRQGDLAVLLSLEGVVDGTEAVDELAHALQCAEHARREGVSLSLLAAALFHDIARSPLLASDEPHERVGAAWCRPRFGEEAAWLVSAHVAAKLHLMATEPDYASLLSPESTLSATHQHAPAEFLSHPLWPEALRLRRFDDAAKDPAAPLPDPRALLTLLDPLRLA